MSVNLCTWVLCNEVLQKRDKACFLFLRTRVFWFHIRIRAADIANADTIRVVPVRVRARYSYVAPWFYSAVQIYYVVVAYIIKPARFVPAAYIRRFVVAPLRGVRAMYNYLYNFSHIVK